MPSQYTVPQFIDIEDKIFGPITVRQFVVVIVGVALLIGSYSLFYKALGMTFLFVIAAILIVSAVIAIAFLKINGRPFHYFLLNMVQSLQHPNLRVWDNRYVEPRAAELPPTPTVGIAKKPPLAADRLARIALLVDTGGIYQNEDEAINPLPSPKSPTNQQPTP